MKRFKQVFGFPSYYINLKGFIWSSKSYKYLRPCIRYGYLRIELSHNNKPYHKFLHRLLLETFIGPCPQGMESCHNSGNKLDNRLKNLRWDTHKDNITDAMVQGTHSSLTGTKLTEQDVINIIYLWNTKLFRQKEIAKMYGIKQNNVSRIANRKRWAWVSCDLPKGV